MTTRFLIIFLVVWNSAYSQILIPPAEKMKVAFDKLTADTSSKNLQANFISAFPSDTATFLSVFMPEKFDQLYDSSHEYFLLLEICSRNFPKEVIRKCVDIGKDLVWDADAVGEVQHLGVNSANRYLKIFLDKYKTLNNKKRQSLINFYADVENHSAYPEYQELIAKLIKIGESDIAKKFETARTIRMKRQDH